MQTKILKKKFVSALAVLALVASIVSPMAPIASAQVAPMPVPVITITPAGPFNVPAGSAVTFTATATDPNATGNISYSINPSPNASVDFTTNAVMDSLTGVFIWTPTTIGTETFDVLADDGVAVDAAGNPITGILSVTINVAAPAPLAVTAVPAQTVITGNVATFTVATTGGFAPLTFSLDPATIQGDAAITPDTGVFTWTTGATLGANVFNIIVDDSSATPVSVSTPVTINVVPVPVLTTIVVTPATKSVIMGQQFTFSATGFDQNVPPVALATQPAITWTSSTPATGTIDPATGIFTAVALGTTTITAADTTGAITGTSAVTVVPAAPTLTTINVTPATPSIHMGVTQQFTAATLDQSGLPFTATVTWASSDTAVGTINATGMFTALTSGTTTITATSGTVTGTTLVTVTPALLVTKINPVKISASADGTYANGWQWIFDVTVPTSETNLTMKFADWLNGSNTIPAASNMQFFSAQSTNAADQAHAISITAANTYSAVMSINADSDLDAITAGRQIQLTVEVKIPTGSAAGSYSTSYGINTVAPAAQ